MNGLFVDLEDQYRFIEFVGEQLSSAPAEIRAVMRCTNKCDAARIAYAASEYQQNINKFAVLLHSKNPDHYKRAGSLLHALYQSKPIEEVVWESTPEELEAGYTRVTLGDAEHVLPFATFYEEFHNEMMAFDIAYRCCASYEENPPEYDFDYLHNVCRYLKSNDNLSVDSLFMLFKSLMRNSN
jgi:hypothetical protein